MELPTLDGARLSGLTSIENCLNAAPSPIANQRVKQKSLSLAEVRSLQLDKLPNSLSPEQKLTKLKNLLAALRTTGLDGAKIVATGAGRTTRWVISSEGFIG